MIVKFEGNVGTRIDLKLTGEVQGFEFLSASNGFEFRFVRGDSAVTAWQAGDANFHSLLHPVIENGQVRTRGLAANDLAVETRALCGHFTLLIWPR